ncbi:hypothetical protein ES703_30559 [subsurface metagenome]
MSLLEHAGGELFKFGKKFFDLYYAHGVVYHKVQGMKAKVG